MNGKWVLPLALLITLIGSTSAAPTVILDESHLVVFKVPTPSDQIAEKGLFDKPGYSIPCRDEKDKEKYEEEYANYRFPACVYWVPYFSLLSYMNSEGRIHVFPAVTRGSPLDVMGIADNVFRALPSSARIDVDLSHGYDPLDLSRSLDYDHLITIVSEYDPMAISSALALKWDAVRELLKRSHDVDPSKVGVVVVFMARATVTSPEAVKDVLIPLVPGANVINPAGPWQDIPDPQDDPFYRLYANSDLVIVVYKTEAFKVLFDEFNDAVGFSGDVVYVRASSRIMSGAPAVIFNVPRRENWRQARMFEPWPSSLYLGALYGLPIAWAAEDLRLEGCRWEGVIIVGPPAEGAMYWDITSEFTSVLPEILGADQHVFLSYMTLTDQWNNSIQVGTPNFYAALPCCGFYPWDLSGIDLTTSTLLFNSGYLLSTYNLILSDDHWFGWGLVGPYVVSFEGTKRGDPLAYTWYALASGFCEWAWDWYSSFGRIPDQLYDVEVVVVGLEGIFALARGLILGGVENTLHYEKYRFGVFFGYPIPSRKTPDVIQFEVNAPNRHYTVIMGRGNGRIPTVPFMLAQSGDVYAILTLQPLPSNPSPINNNGINRVVPIWIFVPLLRSHRLSSD
ncbi:hypothetical protein [Methanopyrus sp. KOL6]|uniref:hypothetical protein n=1 Tax=Methanopyrus sp. KOL6 TaxID=1937004 RepID=UPI000B4BD1B2|nr:hypothetical protein [Methanopyrus sp. KOL6]